MKKVDWICNSTGKEYIDTGFKPNQDTRVVMSVSDAERNAYFFTSWSQEWNVLNYSLVNDYEYSSQSMFSAYGDQNTRLPLVENAVIDYDKNVVKFNDVVSYTFNYIAFQSLYSLYLFAQNRKNSVELPPNYGSFKLHYCKMYDNGVIVRDFIPALDDNNVPCLYEQIEQKFYYNKGSGAFSYPKHYANIEEIVEGVSNATQLRTNRKQDDGTDTVTGVDWFSYGGTVCNNIYANGNGWIGFGASSEHLKVNRRDQAMWNLWREEGTVKNRRFLRIRWSGYVTHNSTSASALLTFDVILLETGDIVLYIADIPTEYYNGTFSLGSLTYDKPTTDKRYVTFYLQTDGSYVAEYAPISYNVKKYLVRNNGTLYTVSDGALVEVAGTLNADLFINNGSDTIPDGALLMTLSAPEVLCWTDSDTLPTLVATVQGIPQPQVIVSEEINLMDGSIKGIESVAIDCKGEPIFAVSFDKKASWIMHNGTDWVAVSDEVTGMTKADFEAITTEQWQAQYGPASDMYIRCTLLDEAQSITSITLNFIN